MKNGTIYGGFLTVTMVNILIMRYLGTEHEAEVFDWLADMTGQDTWEIRDERVKLCVVFQLRDSMFGAKGMERVKIIAREELEKQAAADLQADDLIRFKQTKHCDLCDEEILSKAIAADKTSAEPKQ